MKQVRHRLRDSLFMVLLLLSAAVLLSGCGRGANMPEELEKTDETADAAESELQFLSYRTRTALISKENKAVLPQQLTEDGVLSLINRFVRDETPAELLEDPDYVSDGRYSVYESGLFFISDNGTQRRVRLYQPLSAPEDTEELREYYSESRPRAFRVLEDGTILALESSYESWQDETKQPRYQTRVKYYLRVLKRSGKEVSCNLLETDADGGELQCGQLVYVGNGILAVPQRNAVLIFNTEGKRQFTVSTPFPIRELCAAGNDRVTVILEGANSCWLSTVDTAARTVSVPTELPENVHGFCSGPTEGSLCCLRGSEIWLYKEETGGLERLVSLLSLGVNPSETGSLFVRPDGTLIVLQHDWDNKRETVHECIVTAVPEGVQSSVESKEDEDGADGETDADGRTDEESEDGNEAENEFSPIILTLGFTELSDRLEDELIRFNEVQDGIRIEAVDYRNLDDDRQPEATPDILVMDEAMYRRLSGERKLADLTGFLKTGSAEDEHDLFPSVLEALAEEDGSLRRMAGVFRLESMACDADTVGGRTALSMEDLKALLAGMPFGSRLYERYYTADRLLEDLTAVNRRALVEGGQHNAQLYASLQTFAALQPDRYSYADYAADPIGAENRIYDGKLLMLQAHIGTLEELKWYDAYFPSEACFTGWPTESGSASRFYFDEMIGISSACSQEKAEAAWQFVRVLTEEEYVRGSYGFPVRRSLLEQMMNEDASAITYRIDEKGKLIRDKQGQKIEQARNSWYSPEWRRHYEYALTAAQREKLLGMIEHAV